MVGSPCQYGTCELPGACSATIRTEGDASRTRTVRYDDQLREAELVERVGGSEVARRELTTWSADGRVATTLAWYRPPAEGPAEVEIELRYDNRRRVTDMIEVQQGDPDSYGRWTYRWDRVECLSPPAIKRDRAGEVTARREVVCEGDLPGSTRIVEQEAGAERVVRVRRNEWSGRRLRAFVSEYPKLGIPPTRVIFRRNEQGYVIGHSFDRGSDGSVESEEVWDMSCWVATPAGVRRRAEP